MAKPYTADFMLEPVERDRLAALIGPEDENLKLIEKRLGITIAYSGAHFQLQGPERPVKAAEKILKDLKITQTLYRIELPCRMLQPKWHYFNL